MSLRHEISGIGNLVRDPELRYTASGTAVLPITVAVNDNYTTRDGERVERVTYWDVPFWGEAAERMANYNLMKGDLVRFAGTPEIKIEEDREGKPRLRTRVRFGQIAKLGGRRSEGSYQAAEPEEPEAEPAAPRGNGKPRPSAEEDVDF